MTAPTRTEPVLTGAAATVASIVVWLVGVAAAHHWIGDATAAAVTSESTAIVPVIVAVASGLLARSKVWPEPHVATAVAQATQQTADTYRDVLVPEPSEQATAFLARLNRRAPMSSLPTAPSGGASPVTEGV